jgi:hypothetical protein
MWQNLTAIAWRRQASGAAMIYVAEQTFSLPELENEWNRWYDGNLRNLCADIEQAPQVEAGQCLLSLDGERVRDARPGVTLYEPHGARLRAPAR